MITKRQAKELVDLFNFTERHETYTIVDCLCRHFMISLYMYPKKELVKDVMMIKGIITENAINKMMDEDF